MGSEKVFTTASSPESEGIPSRAILNFLQRIDAERICMHGFLLVRHNRIAAEGYWAPWSAERTHRIYSVSKSFVALAVGMMIDEGRLTLDDRVAEYFPDKLPEELHPWLAASTVRDLLTMATPIRQPPIRATIQTGFGLSSIGSPRILPERSFRMTPRQPWCSRPRSNGLPVCPFWITYDRDFWTESDSLLTHGASARPRVCRGADRESFVGCAI